MGDSDNSRASPGVEMSILTITRYSPRSGFVWQKLLSRQLPIAVLPNALGNWRTYFMLDLHGYPRWALLVTGLWALRCRSISKRVFIDYGFCPKLAGAGLSSDIYSL